MAPRSSHRAILSQRCRIPWGGFDDHLQQSIEDMPPYTHSPQHFGPRDQCSWKTIFLQIDGVGLGGGDSLGMIQVHLHVLYTLFLLHQLLLRSSGIRSQKLGTPILENSLKKSSLFSDREWSVDGTFTRNWGVGKTVYIPIQGPTILLVSSLHIYSKQNNDSLPPT